MFILFYSCIHTDDNKYIILLYYSYYFIRLKIKIK